MRAGPRLGVIAGKAGEEAAQLETLGKTSGEEIVGQAGKIGKDLDVLGAKPLEVPKEPEPGARPVDSESCAGNWSEDLYGCFLKDYAKASG